MIFLGNAMIIFGTLGICVVSVRWIMFEREIRRNKR